MTEPLTDTWHSRDLPVLRAIVAIFDETQDIVMPGDAAAAAGVSLDDAQKAILALDGDGIIDASITAFAGGYMVDFVRTVTGRARQAAGSWPTPESGVDRLIAALEHIAENTEDDDERTRLRQFADFLKTSGKQVGISVVSAVLTGQVT